MAARQRNQAAVRCGNREKANSLGFFGIVKERPGAYPQIFEVIVCSWADFIWIGCVVITLRTVLWSSGKPESPLLNKAKNTSRPSRPKVMIRLSSHPFKFGLIKKNLIQKGHLVTRGFVCHRLREGGGGTGIYLSKYYKKSSFASFFGSKLGGSSFWRPASQLHLIVVIERVAAPGASSPTPRLVLQHQVCLQGRLHHSHAQLNMQCLRLHREPSCSCNPVTQGRRAASPFYPREN